jgi:hypothetical protein
MNVVIDGPASPLFRPIVLEGSVGFDTLTNDDNISANMQSASEHAPRGNCVCWGIPFQVDGCFVISHQSLHVSIQPTMAKWFVFIHTSDTRPLSKNPSGFYSPMRGEGQLNEHAADYVVIYDDGTEERVPIKRRHQVGAFERRWGDNCFQAVEQQKPHPVRNSFEQTNKNWGLSQTRVSGWNYGPWVNWLWAWENPHPHKTITNLRFEPISGTIVLSAISAGNVNEQPLRWNRRSKAIFTLPAGVDFKPELDDHGNLAQIQLDLGTVISALPRTIYPNKEWESTYNNQLPEISKNEILIEYTAHPQAAFHINGDSLISIDQLEQVDPNHELQPVNPAHQKVNLRVIDSTSKKPVAVKLHIHGQAGEYLAPVDRHRIINPVWFEDFSVDFTHLWKHSCTYINGETVVNLPLGTVYIEVSKGFEIRPVRKVFNISADTQELTIEIEKVLPWREKGWVTADTHVHFLSPISAMLEGAAEGVNVVNLLASQWGELMTNVGDFDGKTTWGSQETGGDGEYLVRVGTENRQHILGHISLLGYQGPIIAPMTTAGPDEAALGDPVEVLLTEWARMCKQQGGLVVLPHFPNPRAEHAASVISGDIDAIEMTSWEDLYSGIDPYSLADWYRYLNCGYLVAAVGGTDKMSATTAVGTVRTYAHISENQFFTYDRWMDAVRRAETFVTYGPLLDFSVEGKPMGSRLSLSSNGGTLNIHWQVASVTIPTTRVELIVNGEIRESQLLKPDGGTGTWSIKIDRSSWLALLVRGGYPDKEEMIAAHSSPVMVNVEGTHLLAAADAVTILEQIEGAVAYLDTVSTRAQAKAYRRMRLVLVAAYRKLHNTLHQAGHLHPPSPWVNE